MKIIFAMTRLFVICSVGSWLALNTGIASANESEWKRFMFQNHRTVADRAAFASYISNQLKVDEFEQVIPKLSPKEEEWLDGELASGNGQRVIAAINSLEYAKRQARHVVEQVQILTSLIKQGTDAEFRYWTGLAYLLTDRGETEYVALFCVKAKIPDCPVPPGDDLSFAPFVVHSLMISRTIILGVLGPQFGSGFQKHR